MKLLFLVSLALFSKAVLAANGETAGATPHAQASAIAMPKCIDTAKDLESIAAWEKANAKTNFKYEAMKRLLTSSTDEEIESRLIYSEVNAAHCPEFNQDLIAPIAVVIDHRIEKAHGQVRATIFARDQFASSLNIYPESGWKEFLCPSNAKLWQAVQSRKPGSVAVKANNYYLYRHSLKFKPPVWAQKTPMSFQGSQKITSCLRLF